HSGKLTRWQLSIYTDSVRDLRFHLGPGSNRVQNPLGSKDRLPLSLRGAQRRGICFLLVCSQLLLFGSAAGQTNPTSPDFATLSQRAAEASQQNRLDDARALYRKALALRPGWKEGWWSLGTIEYDLDNYAKAARDFEKLIALDAANGTAHAMLGLCQFELGKDESALKNLLEAERLNIVKDEQLRKVALYHLGVLQLRARKYGDAKESLDQFAKDGVRTKELITALGLAAVLVRPK